jgi:hypothetical protein
MIENAPRDRARALRLIRLRKAYAQTGDRRKLKRARRIHMQLHKGQMRRMRLGLKSMSQVMEEGSRAVARFMDSITAAFAQIRTTPPSQ